MHACFNSTRTFNFLSQANGYEKETKQCVRLDERGSKRVCKFAVRLHETVVEYNTELTVEEGESAVDIHIKVYVYVKIMNTLNFFNNNNCNL